MEAAKDFAGFSMGEADVLRKGVGKKNPEFIAKQKPMFSEGGMQPRVRVTLSKPILFNGSMTTTVITKPRNPELLAGLKSFGFSIDNTNPAQPILKHDGPVTEDIKLSLEVLMPGASKEDCDAIWHNIEDHSRYSFNNAHVAAYGMCGSYPTTWLKGNYPSLFMMNLINSESGSTSKEDGYNYEVAEYVEDARQMGLTVLPPCIAT